MIMLTNTMPRYTRRDAAIILGLSKVTLARWAMQKKGPPFIIIGNRAMYRQADLYAYQRYGEPKARSKRSRWPASCPA